MALEECLSLSFPNGIALESELIPFGNVLVEGNNGNPPVWEY